MSDLKKLMNVDYTYPLPDDKNFQEKIYKKREFYYHKAPSRDEFKDYQDVKEYRDKKCARSFALQGQQAMLGNYINPDTPYKGVLIFHGTGTGKTGAGITIAEKFKPMVQKYGTKIYVLVSGPLIKENWKRELLLFTGETYMKKEDNSVYISDAERNKAKKIALNTAMQYYRFMSYRSFYKKTLGEKIPERVKAGDRKKVVYRKTKEGEFERDIAIDRIYNLDNSVIIIDEAHNLTGNGNGEALMKIIKNSKNLKVVLLTATPMKNLADDIIELINYIRPLDKPMQRDKIFNSNKNYLMDFKKGGEEYLRKMSLGYVSYLRGADPLTFAKKIEKGKIPKGLMFTKVVSCKMEAFQQQIYNEALKYKDDTLDRKSQAVANMVFPGLSKDGNKIAGYYGIEGINILKNQLRTNYDSLNKKIGTDILKLDTDKSFDLVQISDSQKTISGNILKLHNLKFFSIKFYKALKKLNRLVWGKKGPKTAFVYSNLVRVGIELFAEILLQNGYLEYEQDPANYKLQPDTVCYFCGKTYKQHQEKKLRGIVSLSRHKNISESSSEYELKTSSPPDHEFVPATFITVTGQSSEEASDIIPEDKKQILDNVFSNINNRHGKFIKFILGSKVMSEAISLKNVSEVHILDVYFNLGKVDQVIGRAIRHCSHYSLMNEDNPYPQVKVYKYAVSDGNRLSTEEELYKKAELKYLLIKRVERILKESAFDCPLNMNGNVFPEDTKKYKDCIPPDPEKPLQKGKKYCPSICDYTQCEYKCTGQKLNELYYDKKTGNYRKLSKNEIDKSTFTNQLAKNEIQVIKNKIKELYKLQYVFTLKELIENIKDTYEGENKDLFEDFFVFKALNDLIPLTENDFNNFKDTIFDKFNRPGYLVYIDKYYIFQPFDQNEDVPMYYRSNFDKDIQYKLTLYNYIKNIPKFKEIKSAKKRKTDDGTLSQAKLSYDFQSTMDYYDNRNEFKYVGIVDKESNRAKNKATDILADVFKIREKRSKILQKKRGTGIPSIYGAVCFSSKSKEYLQDIAKSVKIKLSGNETRTEICNKIKERFLFLEKYSTDKKKNKMTYIMIPFNHPVYQFPYNIEDRKEYKINKIKEKIKFDIDIKTKEIKKSIKGEDIIEYNITIKATSAVKDFDKFFSDLGFKEENGKYIINIE